MTFKARNFKALAIIGLTALLSGCNYALLNPQGMVASEEKRLLIVATLLMLIIVVPVIILTLGIAWRYRETNTKADYKPEWSHSTLLEVICWSVPCVIIGILAVITWISTHQLDPYRPLDIKGKPLTIQAIALEWKWLFIYPDQHIATVNFVQMPVNVPVRFLITSDAPMNSFQIPQLASQIYAMAGMQTKLNLVANAMGDYQGLSTNFSGEGFSNMNFIARVSSQKEFDAWVKKAQKSPKQLTIPAYQQLAQPSVNNPVEYFSSTNKDLFTNVMMKFMMPMPNMTMDHA